jgi:hypothetical protein
MHTSTSQTSFLSTARQEEGERPAEAFCLCCVGAPSRREGGRLVAPASRAKQVLASSRMETRGSVGAGRPGAMQGTGSSL